MPSRRDRPVKKESQWRGTVFSVSLASAAALFWAAEGIFQSFLKAAPFQVEQIQVVWPEEVNLPSRRYRLKPSASIFDVDLQAVGRALENLHPAAEVEAVRRVLPNRLVALLRLKKVLGQVRADQYYAVSAQGAVVAPGRPFPWPNLPVIFLDKVRGSLGVGSRFDSPAFWKASELLVMVHQQGGVRNHRVNSVKSNSQMLTLLLDSGLEIRFKPGDLEGGWQRLMKLAARKPEILTQARYLDLRFEDPVIGEKKKR